jgi:tRNA pseudouridine32 synthase / 23S rRNA pseudouridine746 synthase
LSASAVALPPGDWVTLLDFLAQRFPAVDRDEWLARTRRGEVIDEQSLPVAAAAPYRPNSKLFYYRSNAYEPRIPFDETILFQDELIVVADKPHFLPVTPGGRYVRETLLVRLKQKLGIDTLSPMHRIDRETAGLVVFTVQPTMRDVYQRLFRERRVEKIYEAIAPRINATSLPIIWRSRLVESAAFMQMREVAGEANAETHISLIDARDNLARYCLQPSTGQKHQLRAHMAALGAPILNDRIYPVLRAEDADQPDYGQPLQLLAQSIAFTDPVTGQARRFESQRTLSAWVTSG